MMGEERDTTIIIESGVVEIEGEAEVFGCPVKKVVTNKPIPVYVKKGEVRAEGKYIALKGNTIPKSWEKLANKDYNRIFLFGDVDTGKSGLATYLANNMDGLKYVLDLDIGQSDIAHPAAMGFGNVDKKILSISQIEMEDGFFIGSTSPMGREVRCIRGVAALMQKLDGKLSKSEKLIVDTTGWVKGRKAREYKLAKIKIINPDVVVCFNDVDYLADLNANFDVFNVESFVVKKKSREHRISIRSELYKQWLENADEREFKLSEIKLGNTNLFKGKRIEEEFIHEVIDSKIVFIEKGYDFLNVCVEDGIEVGYEVIKALKGVFSVEDVCIFSFDQLKGLVVGLYGDRYLGMGIVNEIDQENIKILTNVGSEVRLIEFGEFKLENMKEYIVRVP